MNFETVRSLIATTFHGAWNQTTLKVVAENQPHSDTNAAWGRFVVLSGAADPLALGGQNVRLIGFAVLQVFLPENTGTKKATDCGDAFAAIFNRRQLRSGTTTVSFYAASMVEAGGREGYIQKNFTVQFRADTL
jgi:hypothetical protein